MFIGILVFSFLEKDWTGVDAAYFLMATMSTVGYGDLSPSSDGSRAFTLLMIFVGIVFIFSACATLISDITDPITRKGRQFLERMMPQVAVDLDGDGDTDYMKPRPAPIYYAKNLFPSFMLTITLQLCSAAVFCAVIPEWTFSDAFYHCLVTATTVGYGDVPNSTQAGRLVSCFHILLSVCMLGELISTFDDLKQRRQATLDRIANLERKLDVELFEQLMERAVQMRPLVVRDGKGLTELEFVLAMLVELNVVQWEQVKPFIKRFRYLDVDGDARLGRRDLEIMEGKTEAELKAMFMAKPPEEKMTVEARMGVMTSSQAASRKSLDSSSEYAASFAGGGRSAGSAEGSLESGTPRRVAHVDE